MIIPPTTTAPTLDDLRREVPRYHAGGISMIVTGRDKRPLPGLTWKERQTTAAPLEQIERELNDPRACGMAAICGMVSGGLEVLDFDEPGFYEAWRELVGELGEGLAHQKTQSGMDQVWYRCDEPGRDQSLAWVPDDTQELGRRIAIETRGEGGYAVMPGSRGPDGFYRVVAGDFANIPHISMARRNALLDAARKLCKAPLTKKQNAQAQAAKPKPRPRLNGTGDVIGEFNRQRPIRDVLQRFGYVHFVGDRFTRPGTDASPGGVVILDNDRSYHHSTNDPLNDGHAHDSFSVFCELGHAGNVGDAVKAAAAELGIKGSDTRHTTPAANAPDDAPPLDPEPCGLERLMLDNPTLQEPIVPGLIRRGEVGTICGASKSRKSWTLFELGMTLASDRPGKAGWYGIDCPTGRVLLIDLELHPSTIAYRAKRVQEAIGAKLADFGDRLHLLTMRGKRFNVDVLERMAQRWEAGSYDLIIVDPLYRCYPHDHFDENSNADMAALYARFAAIAANTSAALLIVHHLAKGSAVGKHTRDQGSGAGAMARAGDVHAAIITNEADEDAAEFRAVVRSFPPLKPIPLRWRGYSWQVDDFPVTPATWTPQAFAERFVSDVPQSRKTILAAATKGGVKGRTADTLFAQARDGGQLVESREGQRVLFTRSKNPPDMCAHPIDKSARTYADTGEGRKTASPGRVQECVHIPPTDLGALCSDNPEEVDA